ncbi:MAG: 4Fe-4S dicluster domain-containing protein [Proteobacteria bacterium]|nr:4Fe-4S dicluster domain-containing protein [Pseudomonadota bacterium]
MKITIDGIDIQGQEEMTILEAAEQADIEIPTLCHIPKLSPTGVCRICLVEVEGARLLAAACHTPVADGMVVHTGSPKVREARKTNIALLLSGHTGDCVNDENADNCRLHNLASDLEVAPPVFHLRSPRYHPLEETSPYVHRNLSKCILCRKCVKVCTELAEKNVLAVGYRGSQTKIVVDFDASLEKKEACRDCGLCVEHCPTGALYAPVEADQTKKTSEAR